MAETLEIWGLAGNGDARRGVSVFGRDALRIDGLAGELRRNVDHDVGVTFHRRGL